VLAFFLVTVSLVHAAANFAYIANNTDGTVSVINTTTHLVIKTLISASNAYGRSVLATAPFRPFPARPLALTEMECGPLYTTLDDPVALAVDSLGSVYEVDDADHRVRSIK